MSMDLRRCACPICERVKRVKLYGKGTCCSVNIHDYLHVMHRMIPPTALISTAVLGLSSESLGSEKWLGSMSIHRRTRREKTRYLVVLLEHVYLPIQCLYLFPSHSRSRFPVVLPGAVPRCSSLASQHKHGEQTPLARGPSWKRGDIEEELARWRTTGRDTRVKER